LMEFFVLDLADPFFRERLAAVGRDVLQSGADSGHPAGLALKAAVLADGEVFAGELFAVLSGGARLPQGVERADVIAALSASPSPQVIDRLIDMAGGGELRSDDLLLVLSGLAENPAAGDRLWVWLKANHRDLAD